MSSRCARGVHLEVLGDLRLVPALQRRPKLCPILVREAQHVTPGSAV